MGLLRSAAGLVPRAAVNAAALPVRAARSLPTPPHPPLPSVPSLPHPPMPSLSSLPRPSLPPMPKPPRPSLPSMPRPPLPSMPSLPHPSLPRPPTFGVTRLHERAEVANLVGSRTQRRVWSRDGRAYVEVRGLRTRADRRALQAVRRAVRALDGVRWAEVNAVTGELLASFDEGTVSLDRIVDAVEGVETAERAGETDEEFPGHGHPADRAPLTAEAIALASDCTAFALAATGRVVRWPRLPRGFRAAVALVDAQPRLRRELEARLGAHGADLALSLGNAVVHGLTQEPGCLAVDALYRAVLLGELAERRAVWCRREEDMSGAALPAEGLPSTPRPVPLARGPIEKYADRSAVASLIAAGGVLALGRDPGAAADMVLAAVPKAARLGREGFAATLGRGLGRAGVVPLQGVAYRRLDRISAVVLDSAVLCGDGLQILDADDAPVWRVATRLLAADPGLRELPDEYGRVLRRLDPGSPLDPEGLRMEVVEPGGRVLGAVRVGCRIDPLADAVLAAARESGVRVLLTEHASGAELLSLADDTLSVATPLAEHVRVLQSTGEGVLVATAGNAEAALAADIGVAVLGPSPESRTECWGADLVCGPGLEQLWRLLTAIGVARRASERAVRLALGGTSLAALLVLTGQRRSSQLTLSPVYSAALVSLVGGVLTARRVITARAPTPLPRLPWHAFDADTALERATALRPEDVALRAARNGHGPPRHGPVRTLTEPVTGLAVAVGHELRDPLTPVLVLGAAASAIVGSGVDAALVGGVMAGNAVISGVQRMRAERALSRLLLGQRPPARRLLPGHEPPPLGDDTVENGWERIPADDLYVGDIVAIGPSDVVPADARLLATEDLEVDEASLTGESLPVSKSTEPAPGADLADRSCMVYEGSTVLTGHAHAVVVATGDATQAGRAAAIAGRAPAPAGVQAQLNELTRLALPVTGLSGVMVGALAFARGVSVRQAVSSGVSVAVAAVPEGLPLVATVAQLAAARRLSRRNVLVRTSRTLGTMGRVDTLCFDKTGTLTEGRLKVVRLAGLRAGAEPDSPLGRRLLTTAARACPEADGAAGLPHATDRAVVEAARSALGEDAGWRLVHETPFEPSRGYAAATGMVAKGAGEAPFVAVKGAPEVVLPRCDRVVSGTTTRPLTEARREEARRAVRRLAEDGLRVLAVAQAHPDEADLAEAEKLAETAELALVGFLGIADAPRADAPAAIERLTRAGIRVVMITGDHPATAQAVAADLGIPAPDRVLTGAELDRLGDKERTAKVSRTSVFARVSPEHKVRIVQSLQRAGRTVAMTGDGANDAAAIRLADVGIGLSTGDSRAAQSAADLILRGGDLPAIVEALLEGRALWESVRNAVSILVGGNAGEVAFTVYGTAIGGRAPLSTRQLLLVNTLTDMLPALAVALAPPSGNGESDETGPAAPPVRSGPLADPLHEAIALRGAVTALGSILAWHGGRLTGRGRRASTMALAALVLTQLVQTLQAGWRSPAVLATCAVSVLVLAAVIETPGVSHFFGCTPLGPAAWGLVAASAAVAAVASLAGPRVLRSLSLVREREPARPTA
ncbi:cation-translocating P-type ATPase [Thermomonospora umbrina]|uniref:Cation-transporting ATPase I n=1 Tax=Thermomonospora umbrina TaxID=111806 RepID=A0A3D9STF7_9ACTN|nr:cation-translocating P-type ATPase [Thermomonospora umbrina]REE94991.1 cation-transporting ATPase I [Thermomonospora umbrina]